MARLIDADKLNYIWLPLTAIPERFATETDVRNAPTIDAVEIVHAEWMDNTQFLGEDDSLCGEGFYHDEDYIACGRCNANFNKLDNCTEKFDYCPHCGARMDGKDGAE